MPPENITAIIKHVANSTSTMTLDYKISFVAFRPSNDIFIDLVDVGSNYPDYETFFKPCVGDAGTIEGGSYLCFKCRL